MYLNLFKLKIVYSVTFNVKGVSHQVWHFQSFSLFRRVPLFNDWINKKK